MTGSEIMQIHLRTLQEKDAPLMLEWMQEPSIACFFRFDASKMTEQSCKAFIESSNSYANSHHYAIADENDEYLGTISLKNIDGKSAEYAISTRKCAHGTGAAEQATKQIFEIAFNRLKLERVFLNVLTDNMRANAFYKKIGFAFEYTEKNAVEIRGEMKDLNWYVINKKDYSEN